ncbi:cytochrome c oxidase assembly protein [Paracidovorax sp. MALMAid1276]|uniref:cytochrome c oxidase assembly protein n=1 Tax=Paracidovorax sp. MALMAid1276 TaxID=3411631 RepID=UPI003B99D33E
MRLGAFSTGATLLALWSALAPGTAAAHGNAFIGEGAHAPIWASQALFAVAWLGYLWGAVLRRPDPVRRALFHGAMLVAGLALFGPFDDMAGSSTAWHMVQHMLLIAVVAPLAVLARPLQQWRAVAGRRIDGVWRGVLAMARRPMLCALLHAAAIWVWHAPGPYMAAVMFNGWHVLEHASFLFTGWLFWWAVLRPGTARAPQAMMALLFTVMHTGLLGALLTFAPVVLYAGESRELWDQQLAGLVMWIPGGAVYLWAAAWLGWRWLARGRSPQLAQWPNAL